jgi:hypothetical protein
VAGWGVEDMGAENTGMAAGVKPRSREAVRFWAQGFTRDGRPGVADGTENARLRTYVCTDWRERGDIGSMKVSKYPPAKPGALIE